MAGGGDLNAWGHAVLLFWKDDLNVGPLAVQVDVNCFRKSCEFACYPERRRLGQALPHSLESLFCLRWVGFVFFSSCVGLASSVQEVQFTLLVFRDFYAVTMSTADGEMGRKS